MIKEKSNFNKLIKNKYTILYLIFLLFLSISFIFVYNPHLDNGYPLHTDEYYHITQSMILKEGNFDIGFHSFEIGFDIILTIISIFFDLVLIYKYLPFLWAAITAFILFYLVKKKSNNYFIAFFSGLFFLSIKTNSNLTGLAYFTPLTFAIPFVFIYLYLLIEGIQNKNKKQIIVAIIIILFLIPTHAISVTFAIPFILILLYMNKEYVIKEWKFFSSFLIIPIIGIFFFWKAMNTNFINSLGALSQMILFKYGWGGREFNNSFTETYSVIGLVLATIGAYIIYYRNKKKEIHLVIIPVVSLITIITYKIFQISIFSPFQRNMYYFTIMLPILSSIGLFSIYSITKKIKLKELKKIICILIIIIVITLTFISYHKQPKNLNIYETIDDTDYKEIIILKNLENGNIIAPLKISDAIYPVSGKHPIATATFYGNPYIPYIFFSKETNCTKRDDIISNNKISYVFSNRKINCNWTNIYSGQNYIYETNISNT